MDDNLMKLGGNIELTGFSELDGGVMIVLKKIVGNYVRKMSEHYSDFEKLVLTMKTVHAKEKGEIYELHAKMIKGGNVIVGEHVDRNLFIAIDNSLKAIMNSLDKSN